MRTSRKTWSWRSRLLLMLLLFAVVPMLGISFWSLDTLEDTYETGAKESLVAIARARVEGIGQLLETRRRDVEFIANQIVPRLISVQQATARFEAELDGALPQAPPEPLPELKNAQQKEPLAPTPAAPSVDAGVAAAAGARGAGGADGADGAGSDGKVTREAAAAPAAPAEPPKHTPSAKALAEARAELYQVLRLILWDQAVYEELMVIGQDGVVIASTFSGHEGKTAKQLEYFESGVKATYLQPTFLSPITGKLTMVIATPLRGPELDVHGVLAVRLNLERFFRLVNDLSGLGQTGEIVVGKQIDGKVEIVAPTRHAGRDALGMKIEMNSERARPLQQATSGLEGASTRDIDYRGKIVIAAWQPVPSLDWGLVVKLDHDEATRPVQTMRRQTWAVAGLLLVIASLSAWLVSRELVRPLRALKEATDRISRGDLDVQLDIRSNDEIGELADSFERMVAATRFFREHARRVDEDEEEDTEGERAEPK